MTASTQAIEVRNPIRCLVIQLGRLGDTLQTLMALRAAKQLYPQLEISLLVRENISSAAKRIPWLENLLLLPVEKLTRPYIAGTKLEGEALSDLACWLGPVVTTRQGSWDIVVNWTYSETSSFLAALIPAKIKLGYTRRRDASFYGADGWSHYIQGVVQGGVRQNVHLTDILTTQLLTALQIHVGEPVSDGNTPLTSKSFFSLKIQEHDLRALLSTGQRASVEHSDGHFFGHQAGPITGAASRKWLAIQIGTGSPTKSWAPSEWGRLASMILSKSSEWVIFLLGGPQDQDRAKTLLQEVPQEYVDSGRIVSWVGRTDFDLWASVIGRSQWLLSGETAASHLASVMGTRVLTVSLGPTCFHESGPYGNGHYVVSGGSAGADSEVQAESVYTVWQYAQNEWVHRRQKSLLENADQLGVSETLRGVQVFRSRIRSTGDGGGVVYEPLTPHSMDLNEWTASVMGHIARFWYCGWVPPLGVELQRPAISPALVIKLRELEECSGVLLKICEQASKTATSIQIRASTLKSEKVMRIQDRQEIAELGRTAQDLEALIHDLGKNHFPLAAFGQMLKVLLHHSNGAGLSEVAKESAASYRQIGEGVKIFRDWVRYTLDLAKPIAVLPTEGEAPVAADQPKGEVLI